jgi:predicted Rossmann fold flavoprotein
MAAWRAAMAGVEVVLLEKTPRIGTKILISGGGKCNITHDCSVQQLLQAFRRNEAAFLKSCCYRFTKDDILDMLCSRGLEVYTRPDGRVFPVDQTAKDVVRILAGYLSEAGVDIRLSSPVLGLTRTEKGFKVRLRDDELDAARVIVAVGGSSYPNSGTTGDGWAWCRNFGHRIAPVRAALAPIYLESVCETLAGVALRDCVLKARQGGKEIVRWRGDLLFTHRGISGPATLGISRSVCEHLDGTPIQLEADLTPEISHEELKAELVDYAAAHPKRRIGLLLASWMPSSFVSNLYESVGVPEDTTGVAMTREVRSRLIQAIKAAEVGIVNAVPLEKGEVVAGGVVLVEVDPSTMESRLVPGLFLCGEVLDIAGPVGGYNLQAAFSMGVCAGIVASRGL